MVALLQRAMEIADAMTKDDSKTAAGATVTAANTLDAGPVNMNAVNRDGLKTREITVNEALLMAVPLKMNITVRAALKAGKEIIVAVRAVANVVNKAALETKGAIAAKAGPHGNRATGNAMNTAASRAKTVAATIAARAFVLHPAIIPIANVVNKAVLTATITLTAAVLGIQHIPNRAKAVPATRALPVLPAMKIMAITKMKIPIAAGVFMATRKKLNVDAMRTMIPVHVIGNMPTPAGN